MTSTTDYLPLLAEFEIHGARTYANSAEQNYQQQYAYYQAGNSKVHYKHNATGTAAFAWCRSVGATYTRAVSALSTPTAPRAPATRTIPGPWPPALQPNPAEQSGKIPPTQVGGNPPHTNREEGRRCLS